MLSSVLSTILFCRWPSVRGNLRVPRTGVLTYVLTLVPHASQPQNLPTLLSDSLPGLVTQYVNGFYENGPYEKKLS